MQNEHEKKFNKIFWDEPDDFWENLINLAKVFQDVIPTSSCEVMEKILRAAKTLIPVIESNHSIHISDQIKTDITSLHVNAEICGKEIERKKEFIRDDHVYDLQPPNDYREIDVYPTVLELTTHERPFLRPNIVDRPYMHIKQYFDIQFRLLREDFVRPLREGICKYIEDPKTKKIDDIKIHPKVRFLKPENVNEQNCYRVLFDPDINRRKRKINYEHSRRFMFGALLCFTNNKFEGILFGKVVQRDVKDLDVGTIIVGFDDNIMLPENILEREFLMIESSVYFEPYFHVLNVLKRFDTNVFPMERYIIKVETIVKPPEYLLNIDPKFYQIQTEKFWPLDWGDRQFYDLNESQQRAFKAALTQEFVIIQGPPGTGKTFLGLKIAKTLIENEHVWYNNSPLLIICFTNHALDQFLEGLVPVTTDICRVGGQSKNKNLEQFNIRRHRANYSNQSVIQKRKEVQNYLKEIKQIDETLGIIQRGESILVFDIFENIVPGYSGSKMAQYTDKELYAWLFSGMMMAPNVVEMQQNWFRVSLLILSSQIKLKWYTSNIASNWIRGEFFEKVID